MGIYNKFHTYIFQNSLYIYIYELNFSFYKSRYRERYSLDNFIPLTFILTYLLTYLLSYSMVQSTSWETNWFATNQEIPRISRNPKVHNRTHKRPPPVSILGQPIQSI